MANKDQFLLGVRFLDLFRLLRIQNDFAERSTRTSWQTSHERCLFGFFGCIENREQQLLKVASIDGHQSGFVVQQFWQVVARDDVFSSRHFNGPANTGDTNTLGVTSLQHVQLALLDREFDVLRILVVLLKHRHRFQQLLAGSDQTCIRLFGQIVQVLRSSDTGNNVFTLSVNKVFAHWLGFASRTVASKGNASSTVVAHVSKHHRLDVNRCSDQAGDLVQDTVLDRTLSLP